MPQENKKPLLTNLWQTAIDALLPPRCIGSGEIVDALGMLSPSFWSQLSFIENPMCDTCGMPFGFQAPPGTLCAACMDLPPLYDRARAAVVYNDASRKAVLDFKYGDRLQSVHAFIPWLLRAGAALLPETDVVIPVPLHQKRLWERRFNQSSLLAEALARKIGKHYIPDALIRLRHTVPQKGLSRKDRMENVKNAFGVHVGRTGEIRDKNVLLIDDVFTSGATLNACAQTLKKSGAAAVMILTIARVTKDDFA